MDNPHEAYERQIDTNVDYNQYFQSAQPVPCPQPITPLAIYIFVGVCLLAMFTIAGIFWLLIQAVREALCATERP